MSLQSALDDYEAMVDVRLPGTLSHRNPLPASMFLSHNDALGPPYRVLVDTNFINFSLQNKIELVQGMMDCLMAKCEAGAALRWRRTAEGSAKE